MDSGRITTTGAIIAPVVRITTGVAEATIATEDTTVMVVATKATIMLATTMGATATSPTATSPTQDVRLGEVKAEASQKFCQKSQLQTRPSQATCHLLLYDHVLLATGTLSLCCRHSGHQLCLQVEAGAEAEGAGRAGVTKFPVILKTSSSSKC